MPKRICYFYQKHIVMKTELFILVLFLGMISCNNSNKTSEIPISKDATDKQDSVPNLNIAKQIADASGFQNWDSVSEIAFTFNIDRAGNHNERAWIWKPKTQDVQLISSNDTINYNRSKLDSLSTKTDRAFINDKYWMLAQFQLIWDTGMVFSQKEKVVAPISKDTLSQLTIVYPNEGGYTPGDAYDFFYDENFRIKEWNYRKENGSKPNVTTTWEEYKNFNGIEISTMRRDATGDFKLYFTNISVKKDTQN